jgi:calcineurin-like phosphoesterase family protein
MKINNDNVWFTSDSHFGHTRILDLSNRPWDDIKDMEEALVSNHNEVVGDDDDVFHLGDFSYKCSGQHTTNILSKLKGKIHIIFGNHDKSLRQALGQGLLKDMIRAKKIELIGSPDPNLMTALNAIINGKHYVLSHYPFRSWNRAFRQTIHLYGHVHGNMSPYYKSFDCGVDSTNYYPIHISKIIEMADAVKEDFKEE